MYKVFCKLIALSLGTLATSLAFCEALPPGILFPVNPTSADNLKLSLTKSCSGPYKANAYNVRMFQNSIVVSRGEITPTIQGGCPPGPREEIDLGRLPAGDYTLTVETAPFAGSPASVLFANAPFAVTNARALKQMPWVNLDYTGQWWDPNDSGSGLFIWQDAADNTLVAWFTYSVDGKSSWYVFQPKWQTAASTFTTDLLLTERKPSPTVPPPNPTNNTIAGTATLYFTNFGTADEGTFIVTLKNGVSRAINIKRFKP